MVDLPSPVTQASSPAAAATMRLPTTSKRCSLPSTKRSTITPLPSSTATRPMSSAASQASSSLRTRRPSGTGTPQVDSSSLVRSLSREIPSAMALVRSVSAVQIRRWAEP
ncbi:hypothetical protein G6F35_017109 [Rhizopus arrhizus]|nr:hypothetical protein G6F35_017109 [Rhizopus arrhizus]KAG1241664.1 hypothetical protein G6F68_016569 [Rhizopus microsporus]KAG1385844.1 hypothetical protein G6F59_017168 [Rhizopus arrhizus]